MSEERHAGALPSVLLLDCLDRCLEELLIALSYVRALLCCFVMCRAGTPMLETFVWRGDE